jgi:hypothetical protein
MAKLRFQVVTRRQGELAIDHVVNSVYFDVLGIGPGSEPDYAALAVSVRDAFRQRGGIPAGYGVEVTCYDMADAKPRPIKATAPWMFSNNAAGESVPREVALCLSYYSERNIPRFRGRLFIGPWSYAVERPVLGQRQNLTQLATALGAVGGANVDWQLYSPTRNAFSKITNGWVDDEWDTVRSRGLRATLRENFVTNE